MHHLRKLLSAFAAGTLLCACPGAAWAAEPASWYEIGGQVTLIDQQLFPFRSPYQGPNSLQSRYDNALSHTYTLYLGVRPLPGFELYLDPEMARGYGIGNAVGLAGYANGDVIRNPGLGQDPYVGRAFTRLYWGFGAATEDVAPAENVIGGTLPASRLQLTAGKLGTNDVFDQNRYASNTRTEFENWAFINDPAYDYAADTRGYTVGAAIEWIHPQWTLRVGSFEMPQVANGLLLDPDLTHARGDQAEFEWHPGWAGQDSVVRLLGYMNHARMGNYQQALDQASGGIPDVTSTRQVGAVKYGAGLNLEQPLSDDGDTGLFARLGWDDGQTESFAYTEADRALSLGGQLSGAHWGRSGDRWGLALATQGLSASHQAYLSAGGQGFLLGDGRLNYAPETILESYYACQVVPLLTLSLDYQWIANPGYNMDRGPASVLGVRAHFEF